MATAYSITDINGFASSIRDGAATSIAENYTENLDDFISIEQVTSIIKDKSLGIDDDGFFMITEELFDEIFENVRSVIYQTGLSKLASSGHIECAWDDNNNQMIFWLKSDVYGEMNINSLPTQD